MEELKENFTYTFRKTDQGIFGFIGECDLAVCKSMNSIDDAISALNIKLKREQGIDGAFEDPVKNFKKIESNTKQYLSYVQIDKQIRKG